jgi:integrase
MEQYLADLRERSLRLRPKRRFRNACKLWNSAVDSYSGWPRVRVSVPSYRKTVSFPWDAFPPPFLDDLDRYCAFMSGRDLLAENAPASPRRETTLQAHREHLRRFASGLVHAGFPMEDLTSLSVLVEPRQFETGLRFHLERLGGKPCPSLFETVSILVVVSREYLRLDDDRIEELSAVRNRLRCRERGMTEKNRERLRPLLEPVNQIRFLTMADQLLKRAGSRKSPKRRALDVQTALVHELMLMAPMRFGNLTRLNLDRHFRFEGTGRHRCVFIVIHPEEVKNAQTLEFELLEPTIRLREAYLKESRPVLLHGPEEGWLFPGAKGGHKHQVTLSQRLCTSIERLVGLVFNPHLYRHAAAFFYLQEHPGDYETVRNLLGHTSVETTMKFYAEFEALAARKRYAELILERRTEGLASPERLPC